MTQNTIVRPVVSSSKRQLRKPLSSLAVKGLKSEMADLADLPPHEGLRVKANKNGSKSWYYRYRVGSKLRQVTLGSYPSMDLGEAREEYRKFKKLKDRNIDPKLSQQQDKELFLSGLNATESSTFTFERMIERYLVEKVEPSRQAKGAREVRRVMEKDIGALASVTVGDNLTSIIHNHIIEISKRSKDVARVFRRELKCAWQYAFNTGQTTVFCPINTDMGGKLTQGQRKRSLSDRELELLLPWMHHYSELVRDALTLTLYTGLRSGEVCRLKDEWLVEEGAGLSLVIPADEMKVSHSDHIVPLVGTALEIANRRKGSGYWFKSRAGGCIKQKVLGVEVYSYSGKSSSPAYKNHPACPVANWAPNDLRKTARTHLAKLKCPFEISEKMLHHKLQGVAGLYNQYNYEEERREWLAILDNHFNNLGAKDYG
jgi:integrase